MKGLLKQLELNEDAKKQKPEGTAEWREWIRRERSELHKQLYTEERRKKQSEAMTGRIHSVETKEKILSWWTPERRRAVADRVKSPENGEAVARMRETMRSAEVRERIGGAARERWADPEYRKRVGETIRKKHAGSGRAKAIAFFTSSWGAYSASHPDARLTDRRLVRALLKLWFPYLMESTGLTRGTLKCYWTEWRRDCLGAGATRYSALASGIEL